MEKNLSKSNLLACRPFETCVESPNFSTAHLVGASYERQLLSAKKGNMFLLIPWDMKPHPSMPITTQKAFIFGIPGSLYTNLHLPLASWEHPNWYQKGWRFAPCLAVFFFKLRPFFFWWEVVGPEPLPWASVLNHFCSERKTNDLPVEKNRGAQESGWLCSCVWVFFFLGGLMNHSIHKFPPALQPTQPTQPTKVEVIPRGAGTAPQGGMRHGSRGHRNVFIQLVRGNPKFHREEVHQVGPKSPGCFQK